ncbi:MAG: hypothetical protein FWG57_01740 [Endomicrobia bacterium]|nr:hypothetical protein [Endomicrobiia bacterium]
MFYNYKIVFFLILYGMCAALYHFINKQVILMGLMSGFLLGSAIVYGLIIIASFIAALLIAFVSKYCYLAGCGICRIKPKQMLPQTFWMIFTVLSYAAVFIIFLKMIKY